MENEIHGPRFRLHPRRVHLLAGAGFTIGGPARPAPEQFANNGGGCTDPEHCPQQPKRGMHERQRVFVFAPAGMTRRVARRHVATAVSIELPYPYPDPETASALDALVVSPLLVAPLPSPADVLGEFECEVEVSESQTLYARLVVLGLCARYHGSPGDSLAYLRALHGKTTPTDRVEAAMRALSPEALTECVTVAQLAAGALADDLGSVQRAFLVSDEAAAATFDDLCLRRDDLACVRAVLWLAGGASDALDAALEDLDEEAETHGLAYREAARRVKRDARHDDIAEGDGWWCLEKSP